MNSHSDNPLTDDDLEDLLEMVVPLSWRPAPRPCLNEKAHAQRAQQLQNEIVDTNEQLGKVQRQGVLTWNKSRGLEKRLDKLEASLEEEKYVREMAEDRVEIVIQLLHQVIRIVDSESTRIQKAYRELGIPYADRVQVGNTTKELTGMMRLLEDMLNGRIPPRDNGIGGRNETSASTRNETVEPAARVRKFPELEVTKKMTSIAGTITKKPASISGPASKEVPSTSGDPIKKPASTPGTPTKKSDSTPRPASKKPASTPGTATKKSDSTPRPASKKPASTSGDPFKKPAAPPPARTKRASSNSDSEIPLKRPVPASTPGSAAKKPDSAPGPASKKSASSSGDPFKKPAPPPPLKRTTSNSDSGIPIKRPAPASTPGTTFNHTASPEPRARVRYCGERPLNSLT